MTTDSAAALPEHRSEAMIGDAARSGTVADRGVRTGATNGVDSHGCSRVRGMLLGSVGAAVVTRAKIPVIVTRRF